MAEPRHPPRAASRPTRESVIVESLRLIYDDAARLTVDRFSAVIRSQFLGGGNGYANSSGYGAKG